MAIYGKMLQGENLCDFCGFSLNRECFPTNYGLVDWQCKSTSMLPQKFSHEWQFCSYPNHESFAVYDSYIAEWEEVGLPESTLGEHC